jgi:acyl carrier protein/pimeloyl-ACP methyl ester carboxylesterase
MLGKLLQRNASQIGFFHIDWQLVIGSTSSVTVPPRYSEVIQAKEQDRSSQGRSAIALIQSASEENRQSITASLVVESVASVLRTAVAKIEVNRSLNEMGLDSLMVFEVMNRLEDQFGVSLPTSTISANSTINSLTSFLLDLLGLHSAGAPDSASENRLTARIIEANKSLSDQRTQLVTMRANGSDASLFFIHPAGGGTDIYVDLAAHLQEGYPIYAIQSCMLAGKREEWDTIDEMARSYAGIITRQEPTGALRLAGFSAGGVFALATAAELERLGRRVSLVGMIETPVAVMDPICPREVILTNLIAEVYEHLAGESSLPRRSEAVDLSDSMMKLAGSIVAEASAEARRDLVLNWLLDRGMSINLSADSGAKRFFDLFIRHAILLSGTRS